MTELAQRLAAPARPPALVAVAPDPAGSPGRDRVESMLAAVRRALPHVDVHAPYAVHLTNDSFTSESGDSPRAYPASAMSQFSRPSVLLPLSLSGSGSPRPAAAATGRPYRVRVADPLGPDRLLARALSVRLRQAGAKWGDAVVLAAGNLVDGAALADAEREAAMLASEWGSPVSLACTTNLAPSVEEAVDELRATGAGRVFVAPYLLTHGPLAEAIARQARAAGAIGIGEVLAGHALLVELIVQRYRAAISSWATTT